MQLYRNRGRVCWYGCSRPMCFINGLLFTAYQMIVVVSSWTWCLQAACATSIQQAWCHRSSCLVSITEHRGRTIWNSVHAKKDVECSLRQYTGWLDSGNLDTSLRWHFSNCLPHVDCWTVIGNGCGRVTWFVHLHKLIATTLILVPLPMVARHFMTMSIESYEPVRVDCWLELSKETVGDELFENAPVGSSIRL